LRMPGEVRQVSDELLQAAGDYFVDRKIGACGIAFITFLAIVLDDGLEEQIFAHKNSPHGNADSVNNSTTE